MKGKALALGLLLTAIPLFAHHGGTSLYDISKQITVDATVTEYRMDESSRGDRFGRQR